MFDWLTFFHICRSVFVLVIDVVGHGRVLLGHGYVLCELVVVFCGNVGFAYQLFFQWETKIRLQILWAPYPITETNLCRAQLGMTRMSTTV